MIKSAIKRMPCGLMSFTVRTTTLKHFAKFVITPTPHCSYVRQYRVGTKIDQAIMNSIKFFDLNKSDCILSNIPRERGDKPPF